MAGQHEAHPHIEEIAVHWRPCGKLWVATRTSTLLQEDGSRCACPGSGVYMGRALRDTLLVPLARAVLFDNGAQKRAFTYIQ